MDDAASLKEQEQIVAKWPSLFDPGLEAKSFMANGKEYRVYNTVSQDRYEAYELLQQEIGLARSFRQVQQMIQEAYDCLNSENRRPGDAAVILRDVLIGTTLVGEKQTHAILKLCALFINRADEDIRYIDEGLIESKVNDWRNAGIAMGYFFQFALVSIPGYIEAYRAISQDTSAGKVVGIKAGAEST